MARWPDLVRRYFLWSKHAPLLPAPAHWQSLGRTVRWTATALIAATAMPLSLVPPLAHAATVTVTTFVDEDNGSLGGGTGVSLREAVLYSANGDTVQLAAGTYLLTLKGGSSRDDGKTGDLDLLPGRVLTIAGGGSGSTTIKASFGTASPTDPDRVIDVLAGANLTLSGVTLSGGVTTLLGAGLRNQGTLTADGIVVSDNNSTSNDGGGIGNTGTATIRNSTVRDNRTRFNGGGISNSGTLNAERLTVLNNSSNEQDGGGIFNSGTLSLANSTVALNRSNRNGGGLASDGNATVLNTTVVKNQSDADQNIGGNAGGIYNRNTAAGSVTLKNSIVAQNQDLSIAAGTANFPDLNGTANNTINGNANNVIGSRAGINPDTTVGRNSDTVLSASAVSPDPGLAPIASEGGTVQLFRPLLNTANLVDRADNATCAAAPVSSVDQRGKGRPADGDGDGSVLCDIGAVEIQPQLALLAATQSITNNGTIAFGTTPRNTPLSQTITISNAGDGVLTLQAPIIASGAGFSIAQGLRKMRLNPSEQTSFTVRLDAATLGAAAAQITIANNDLAYANDPLRINLSGTVTPAPATLAVFKSSGSAVVSGTTVPVGITALNTTLTATFTISNSGDQAINNLVASPSNGGFGFAALGTSSLAPGAASTFTATLQAVAAGVFRATAAFTGTDAVSGQQAQFRFDLFGIVTGAADQRLLLIDDAFNVITGTSVVSYGTTVLGTPLTKTFSIYNVGTTPLAINSPLGVTPTTGFSEVGALASSTIAAGAAQTPATFSVRLDGAAVGAYTSTVTLSNDAVTPFAFEVNGIVANAPAELVVRDGITELANGGRLALGSTAFGLPLTRTLTISNTGATTLTLGTLTVPSGYNATLATSSVAPGAATTLALTLTAAASGSFSGPLSLSSSDPDDNPFVLNLSGTVTAAPSRLVVQFGSRTLVNSDTLPVDFGATTVGTPISRTFRISNTGGITLSISSINVPAGFAIDPAVPTRLEVAPGATVDVPVILDTLAEGTFSGNVRISSNDPTTPEFTFQVTGSSGGRGPVYLPVVLGR